MALADQELMLAPLPDPGAGIDHFGISFSLQVYIYLKKNSRTNVKILGVYQ